ncbi:DUF2000 family protein [Planktomarina temperata]|nr:DUF2000 family protein [Planktomarina temperata]
MNTPHAYPQRRDLPEVLLLLLCLKVSRRLIVFDTKIAIIVRDDLATWQKLNITAFLMSGITAENTDLIGEKYVDKDGNHHLPMSRQPVIVLSGAANVLRNARNRANERGISRIERTSVNRIRPNGWSIQSRHSTSSVDWALLVEPIIVC